MGNPAHSGRLVFFHGHDNYQNLGLLSIDLFTQAKRGLQALSYLLSAHFE
jgi:hypothetical protein